MSDRVLNRNVSPLDAETSRRGNPVDGFETDYRTRDNQPQITFTGHIVPPIVQGDMTAPLVTEIVPIPGSYPWGIIYDPALLTIVVSFDEALINWEYVDNWALSGAAAASLSVASVSPLIDGVGTRFHYSIQLAGPLSEGLLEVTINQGSPVYPISDENGNAMPAFTWSYWIDQTRPKIIAVEPATETVLFYDQNFHREILVSFNEFLGTAGQDMSPALADARYSLFLMEDDKPLAELRPTQVQIVSEEPYAFGPDDGSVKVKLSFAYNQAEAATNKLVLRVNDPDKLVDRAGNDLLADALEYHWQVGAVDAQGPTWTAIDPGVNCPVVQPPIDLGGHEYDGMLYVEMEFSEALSGNAILNPANWLVSGVPALEDGVATGGQAYEVKSVTQVNGGATPVYRADFNTVGVSDGTGITVTLDAQNISDMSGNLFSGDAFYKPFETQFVRVSTVSPSSLSADWDGTLDVTFSCFVRGMDPNQVTESWLLTNLQSGVQEHPMAVEQISITSSTNTGCIYKHRLVWDDESLERLSANGGSPTLRLGHVIDKGYVEINGTPYPKMVRAFFSDTDMPPDGSCGGAGVPLSSSSKEWHEWQGTNLTWSLDQTGPAFVGVQPASGIVTKSQLETQILFQWDEVVDWSKVTYGTQGNIILGPAVTDGNRVTMTADLSSVSEGDDIVVSVDNVKDLAGNDGASASAYYEIADETEPRLDLNVSPSSHDLCGGAQSTLILTFSEDMTEQAINPSSYEFIYGTGTPVAGEDLSIVQVSWHDEPSFGKTKVAIVVQGGISNSIENSMITVRAHSGLTDLSGNLLSSILNSAIFFANPCPVLQGVENLDAQVTVDASTQRTMVTWTAPSAGMTPDSYEIYFEGVLSGTVAYPGTSYSMETSFAPGKLEVTVYTKSLSLGLGPGVTTEANVPESYTQPVVNGSQIITSRGDAVYVEDNSINLGPRYWDTDDNRFGLKVDLTGDVGKAHFFFMSAALRGEYALPNKEAIATTLPDASELPSITMFGDVSDIHEPKWIYLGSSTVNDGDDSAVFLLPSDKLWDATNAEGYSVGTQGEEATEWYEQPAVFGDLMLFGVVLEHSGEQAAGDSRWSVPYLFGSSEGFPVHYLPEPLHDHPDYDLGGQLEAYPTLALNQDLGFDVSWTKPERGILSPYSFECGLFKNAKSEGDPHWEFLESVRVSGEVFAASFKQTPEEDTQYMARVIGQTPAMHSWTNIGWDLDGDGFLDIDAKAFQAGWGGRSNVLAFTRTETRSDAADGSTSTAAAAVVVAGTQPSNGAMVANDSGIAGVDFLIVFTGSVEAPGPESYTVEGRGISTGEESIKLNHGEHFVAEKLGETRHQIRFIKDLGYKKTELTIALNNVKDLAGNLIGGSYTIAADAS